jgi:hypothetical protein
MSAYSLPAVATPMNRFSTQYRNCLLQRLRGNLLALEVWTRRGKLGPIRALSNQGAGSRAHPTRRSRFAASPPTAFVEVQQVELRDLPQKSGFNVFVITILSRPVVHDGLLGNWYAISSRNLLKVGGYGAMPMGPCTSRSKANPLSVKFGQERLELVNPPSSAWGKLVLPASRIVTPV